MSIILPSHNYRDLVGGAVESVLAQSYRDWELVIVDDGSTDGAAELLADYARNHPDRIRLMFHEGRANRGLVETYRAGIAHARGELIAFIEADDLWYPQNLALKVAMLDRYPDATVVHDRPELFGDPSAVKSFAENQWLDGSLDLPSTDEPFYAFTPLMHHNFVMTFSAFITRREALAGTDLDVPHEAWLDWWLLVQLSLRGQFISLPESCTKWRLHQRSLNNQYLATLDVYREAVLFRDAIFRVMERYAAHPPGDADPALTTELRHRVRSERAVRARRWLRVKSRTLLMQALPAGGYRTLKKIRRRLRRRLVLKLEEPADGRLTLDAYQAVDGWAALSNDARITRIEAFYGARPVGELNCGKPRPDVRFVYRDIAHAGRSGFSGGLAVPPRPGWPYRVVAWDETGRWHWAFTLRLPRGASWKHRLKYELGRWASLPGWWRALRAKRGQRAPEPTLPLHILVAGLPKTGTSALYYNIKNSTDQWSLCLFEPRTYDRFENAAAPTVIAKILLASQTVDYASFDDFDRKVLIVRDPRDTLISGLLYSIWNAPYGRDELKTGEWLALLRQKEADPASLSVMDLLDRRKALLGQSGPSNVAQYGARCDSLMRYHDERPECFVITYEEFLDRKLVALEDFLGFQLAPSVGEGVELERVGRTKTYGDWANWFRASDRELFRPLFAPFMARYGYPDDWTLPTQPRIDPSTASRYVERLLRMKRRR